MIEPRVYIPYANVAVVYFDDIHAKVDIYWDEDRVVIRGGGSGTWHPIERPLSDYDAYEDDMRSWILSLREG